VEAVKCAVLAILVGCNYTPTPASFTGDGAAPGDSNVTPVDTMPVGPEWTSRRTLTINNEDLDALTGFPLHVSLNSTRIDYGQSPTGADLRFEDAVGTPLAYEIERWDPAGTSTVWVRIPMIAAGTTTSITMYYGNPDATDAQNAAGVWDDDYLGVWHLVDAHDSTATSTSTNNGGVPTLAGKTGPAMDFAGNNSDDHIDTGLMTFTAQWTVEAWINPAGAATTGTASSPISGFPNYMILYSCGQATFCRTVLFNHNNGNNTSFAPYTVPAQTWSYVAGRYDGATIRAFVDGAQVGNNPTTATPDPQTVTAKIGSRMDLAGDFDGLVDEVRISKVARSVDYLEAQHRSMADTYVTFGPETTN
jgi:hypothetical protein